MKRNVVRNELAWCIFLYWVKWGVLFVGDGVAVVFPNNGA